MSDLLCPRCKSSNTTRALSFGLPMALCGDCDTGWGFATWFHELFPWTFSGELVAYEAGGYFGALWHWLRGHDVEE